MKAKSITQRAITRFMRVFFYLLYEPMSCSYDLIAWIVSWGRWKEWGFTTLPYLKGPCVLELGHGPGHLQVALHGKGISALGIDASRQMGRQAYRQISKHGYIPQLIYGYAQMLPFCDLTYDQIVATFPTEYIYEDKTLAEAYRVLKNGGTFVVLPAAWITGKSWIDRTTAQLFRVTGQSPDWASLPHWESQWLEPFNRVGFQTEVEMITRKSWSLLIILAHKIV